MSNIVSSLNCIALFESWLESSRHRFNGHEPVFSKKSKKSVFYNFKGITKHIRLCVTPSGGFVVAVENKNICIDLIADFDIAPEKTKLGRFYCVLCAQEYRRYYGSVENLFINHCAEQLVTWVTKKFNGPKRLLMVGLDGGSFARILDSRDLSKPINRRRRTYKTYELVKVVDSF